MNRVWIRFCLRGKKMCRLEHLCLLVTLCKWLLLSKNLKQTCYRLAQGALSFENQVISIRFFSKWPLKPDVPEPWLRHSLHQDQNRLKLDHVQVHGILSHHYIVEPRCLCGNNWSRFFPLSLFYEKDCTQLRSLLLAHRLQFLHTTSHVFLHTVLDYAYDSCCGYGLFANRTSAAAVQGFQHSLLKNETYSKIIV